MGLEEQKRAIEKQIEDYERKIRPLREQKERLEEQVRKIKRQIDAIEEKIRPLEKYKENLERGKLKQIEREIEKWVEQKRRIEKRIG
jgi:chromosome segregation ATPase